MPPREPQPRHRRDSIRYHARLDAETEATLEALATTLHRMRAALLRYVMQWGLAHTDKWIIHLSTPARPHLVHLLVDPERLQQAQGAAEAHGVTMTAWVRHAMRQVTREDFPPSWRAGDIAMRLHDSGYFNRKFGLRLDEVTSRKLEAIAQTFDRSAAEIIRQFVTQAISVHFPSSWQLAVEACRHGRRGAMHE
jgi:predicted transcriptional regulator